MDPIILCTWYQMDKHGWFVRDMGRVFDAFANELHVGGFFSAHSTGAVRKVSVFIWRIVEDGVESVGGTTFEVKSNPFQAELVLSPITLQSQLSPGHYELELEIEGEVRYETTFETRQRNGPNLG